LGEHNAEILGRLGYSAESIGELEKAGVLGHGDR
jgi:crotonobetainyl-CoA:carnitine CoA-transferase CaiB-like acyl-CoA transferase